MSLSKCQYLPETIVTRFPVAPIKNIAVVVSRNLSPKYGSQVGQIVDYLLSQNYHITTGGAKGADDMVLKHLLHRERPDRGAIFSAWDTYKGFPVELRKHIRYFHETGGAINWGTSSGSEPMSLIKMALLNRNIRLVQASEGVIAFMTPESRGTFFTVREAVRAKKKLVVFPINRLLPGFSVVKWVPLKCGGCWEGGYKAVYLK
jgi:predicted Rossmann fold nucleotide-binding protein DprA/Smf involved in DNA uptake